MFAHARACLVRFIVNYVVHAEEHPFFRPTGWSAPSRFTLMEGPPTKSDSYQQFSALSLSSFCEYLTSLLFQASFSCSNDTAHRLIEATSCTSYMHALSLVWLCMWCVLVLFSCQLVLRFVLHCYRLKLKYIHDVRITMHSWAILTSF